MDLEKTDKIATDSIDAFAIDMEAIKEISQKDHKSGSFDEQDLDKVLPKLAKRINDTQIEQSNNIDSSIPIVDDSINNNNNTRGRSLSKARGNSIVVQLSSGLTPEMEKLRTQDITPDDNSAAFYALNYKSSKYRENTIESQTFSESTTGTVGAIATTTSPPTSAVPTSEKRKKKQPKRKVEGRVIKQDHKQYELTYAMMLGIRVMTGRCDVAELSKQRNNVLLRDSLFKSPTREIDESSHQYDWNSQKAQEMLLERELVTADFQHSLELKFNPEGGNTDNATTTAAIYSTPKHKLKFSFMFKDYVPKVFRAIRGLSNIKESDYMISIAGEFNYIEFLANSKSGQFFFYSHDGKYMIKTQSKPECLLLRQIMPKYVQHLSDHPDSLLVRFYGMHRVKFKTQTIYFVIMSSVFDTNMTIDIKYDLKGSLQGRLTSEKDCKLGKVQKDVNLIENRHNISLTEKNMMLFHDVLQADVTLLSKLNIMDYSLLIGIHFGRSKEEDINKKVDPTKLQVEKRTSLPPKEEENYQDDDAELNTEGSIFQSYNGGICGEQHTDRSNGSGDREPDVYFMGVIDILQLYDTGKMTESIFKGIFTNRMELSAICPDLYAKRLLDFIMKHTNYNEVIAAATKKEETETKTTSNTITTEKPRIKHNPNWAKIANYIQTNIKEDRRKELL